ncbi:MAG: ankyrin repeat domain-containing protein [Alphaproteobacteria bacterium]|nr:ankyrin repeat domain-containing protein [Alphaproteobacteria bacterium]
MVMKFRLIFVCSALCALCSVSHAAGSFEQAAQLLSAARAGDTRRVESLVRAGADINYVDNTGLSIVCTAIMNKDMRAAQILQVYGADASKCDQQIKRYNQRKNSGEETGFFSGLSTPQNMTLMIGAGALVAGGLIWLASSSIGPGNSNPGSGNEGGHGGGGGTNPPPTTENPWTPGALPYGPSGTNFDLNLYSDPANSPYYEDFLYMSGKYADPTDTINFGNIITDPTQPNYRAQNYLLIMNGYAPLARGYLGQATFRLGATGKYAPVEVLNGTGGGRPILTALITNNGINPTGSAVRGNIDYATSAAADATTYAVDKYYNNAANGGAENPIYDLSGYGTVFNPFAAAYESSLAKIIAGWEFGGRAVGDYYGFAPNSQLVIFRTGGGRLFTIDASPSVVGDANGSTFETITTVTVGGVPYTVSFDSTTQTFTVSGPYGFSGYVGNDGLLYVDMGGDTTNVYSLNASDEIVTVGQLAPQDYQNYRAMLGAANLGGVGNRAVNVIANAALTPKMRRIDAATINDALVLTSVGTSSLAQQDIFTNLISSYYGQPGSTAPGNDAGNLFSGMGNSWTPMLIFSTGEFNWGLGDGKSLSILDATFENLAPALYTNLNRMFMSVVAVQTANGTTGITSVTNFNGNAAPGKIVLSSHQDADGNTYAARACGMAGKGTNAVDPWCFAAAGATGEQAVASMAGAVAAINGAFSYMSTAQIFTLLALTSDGTLLAPNNNNGTPRTRDELIAFLQNKYELPPEYAMRVTNGEDYLGVFAEVFGYGLVNLERATRPNTNVYFSGGTSIKNGMWRSANSGVLGNTMFSMSGAFGARGSSVSVPVFDILESADGSLTLPRVFENNFALNGGRRGVYLGDALGEFEVRDARREMRDAEDPRVSGFASRVSFSESNRVTNMSGLNELSLGYDAGGWRFDAEYKHRYGDKDARRERRRAVLQGDGANPILYLASDSVASGAAYTSGAWTFGARAFSGQVTDEQLLQNDPAISNRYEPMRLGLMQGAQSSIEYKGEKFALQTAVGAAHESNTVLGAYSDGLLGMGGGDTIYFDSVASIAATDSLNLTARATFANTSASPTGDVILGLSSIQSNAFSVGADYKNWSFTVSQPLAVTRGHMRYATMNYEVVESDTGYELNADPYVADLNLAPDARETRFSFAYRTQLGPATSAALGLVYRVNPDNTRQFGNESIFMMKIRHRLGI